jgi:hypothetical protein
MTEKQSPLIDDVTRLMYDYLSSSEVNLTNQLLKVSLNKWYFIDRYIDKYVCDDEKEYYKNWIRLVRKNTIGPLYLKIQPFYMEVCWEDILMIDPISYRITLSTDVM